MVPRVRIPYPPPLHRRSLKVSVFGRTFRVPRSSQSQPARSQPPSGGSVNKKLLATAISGVFAASLIAAPAALAADQATLTIQATPSTGLHPGDTFSVAGKLALAGS